ncbi:ComF family protein [Patescibacteria group bacterium]|nr:ComF family protein [Patescibacteria group bacterium]
MNLSSTKEFILDLLFPKFCISCGKEGSYLCQDCFSLIDILERQYCPFCPQPKVVIDGKTCNFCKRSKSLNGLYCAASYNNFIVKKLINQFKYEPYIKELSKPLSSSIIAHFINLNKVTTFNDFILIPIPLHKKKLKKRGFNQASEIAKELSKVLKIPFFDDILIKIKQTPAQVELKKEEREENIKGVFLCQKPELVMGKKIFLIDDIFTTGSTMEQCARLLQEAGAKEVWGIVVARG